MRYGATFKVKLDGASQCFTMPAAGWSSIGAVGFRYADPHGVFGPVRAAQVKRTRNFTFHATVTIVGKLGAIDIVPPNPGVRGDVRLRLRGGADYCGSTAGGLMVANDAKRFTVKDAPAPAACAVAACSPGGAFVESAPIHAE